VEEVARPRGRTVWENTGHNLLSEVYQPPLLSVRPRERACQRPLRVPYRHPHAARSSRVQATRVKNKGAFPPADARTYRPEEGSDAPTVDAASTGEAAGSLD
jgi:hypothetical protein